MTRVARQRSTNPPTSHSYLASSTIQHSSRVQSLEPKPALHVTRTLLYSTADKGEPRHPLRPFHKMRTSTIAGLTLVSFLPWVVHRVRAGAGTSKGNVYAIDLEDAMAREGSRADGNQEHKPSQKGVREASRVRTQAYFYNSEFPARLLPVERNCSSIIVGTTGKRARQECRNRKSREQSSSNKAFLMRDPG